MTIEEEREIHYILKEYLENVQVQSMRNYIQHGSVSTYRHCWNVVNISYELNKFLHLHANKEELLIGALLHDFYLYDWHENDPSHRLHGYHHALTSKNNAVRYFDINENIQNIIYCHMWPLNITRIPQCKEAWIVCMADKYSSIIETLFYR